MHAHNVLAVEVLVSDDDIGPVFGVRGATIKDLEQQHLVQMVVPAAKESSLFRIMSLVGSAAAICSCIEKLRVQRLCFC